MNYLMTKTAYTAICILTLSVGIFGAGKYFRTHNAQAAGNTYFLRDDGLASQSQAKQSNGGSCSSESKAMSISMHNSGSFSPGDTIYICGAITKASALIPPSSGTEGSYITYRGDYSGYPGSFEQPMIHTAQTLDYMINIKNKQYIVIKNLKFSSDVDANHDISNKAAIHIQEWYELTGHITVEGNSFFQTCAGFWIEGDVKHVNIFRSNFSDMTTNGVGTFKHWSGSGYTAVKKKPSFITVGGSRENGNTFKNIGRENNPTSGSVPGQAFGTQSDDTVFSYNHVYADAPGWGTGVYMNGVDRSLVEYNYFHDLDAMHRRPAITFKSDSDWKNTDVVIRFNKVGPTHLGDPGSPYHTTYVNPDYGIRLGRCMENGIIYGNYVAEVEAAGINANWGWGVDDASDGCIMENIFIYSNIIDTTIHNSGIVIDGTGEGTDRIKDTYIVNNDIYGSVSNYDSEAVLRYCIQAMYGDHKYEGMTITNNIIDSCRDNDPDHIGLRVRTQSDFIVDYNHHHFPGTTPSVYYDSSKCAYQNDPKCTYDWNSPDRPAGYGAHDTGGNPLYVDAAKDNFALTAQSPLRDTGKTMVVPIPSVTIQGEEYDFSFADAFHPSTDWTKFPSPQSIITANQNNHGSGWERGAYVYVDGNSDATPPTAPAGLSVR